MACGCNEEGQRDVPALLGAVNYAQVAAGDSRAVLLRSDGTPVACGIDPNGACEEREKTIRELTRVLKSLYSGVHDGRTSKNGGCERGVAQMLRKAGSPSPSDHLEAQPCRS